MDMTTAVPSATAAAATAAANTTTDDASVQVVIAVNEENDDDTNNDNDSRRRRRRGWNTVDEIGLIGRGDGWIESNQIKSNQIKSNQIDYGKWMVTWRCVACQILFNDGVMLSSHSTLHSTPTPRRVWNGKEWKGTLVVVSSAILSYRVRDFDEDKYNVNTPYFQLLLGQGYWYGSPVRIDT